MVGNERGAVPLIAAVVLIVIIAALLLGGSLGWFSGTGEGDGAPSSEEASPSSEEISTDPAPVVGRPLRIEIDGESYQAGGETVTVRRIVELSGAVPDGSGPAVVIVRRESSRAKAEKTLMDALNAKKISFRFENAF